MWVFSAPLAQQLTMHWVAAGRVENVRKRHAMICIIPLAANSPIWTRTHPVRIENAIRMILALVPAPNAMGARGRVCVTGILAVLQAAKLPVLIELTMTVVRPRSFWAEDHLAILLWTELLMAPESTMISSFSAICFGAHVGVPKLLQVAL